MATNQDNTFSDCSNLNDNRHPGQDNDNPSMSSATEQMVGALTGTTRETFNLKTVQNTSSQGETVAPTVVNHPYIWNQEKHFSNIHGSTNLSR